MDNKRVEQKGYRSSW